MPGINESLQLLNVPVGDLTKIELKIGEWGGRKIVYRIRGEEEDRQISFSRLARDLISRQDVPAQHKRILVERLEEWDRDANNLPVNILQKICTPIRHFIGWLFDKGFLYQQDRERALNQWITRREQLLDLSAIQFQVPIGVQPATQLRFNAGLKESGGTPGVDLRGSDLLDQRRVQERIDRVTREVLPLAHTVQSKEELTNLGAFFIAISSDPLNSINALREIHETNKASQINRFGRQLSVSVIGLGPVGLAAALTFYRLGFKVDCFEKRSEEEFKIRPQPFSLVREVYMFFQKLGLSFDKIFETFGEPQITDEEVQHQARSHNLSEERMKYISQSRQVGDPRQAIMRAAKQKRIGERASEYVPNNLSLSIKDTQKLLIQTISDYADSEDLSLHFSSKLVEYVEYHEREAHHQKSLFFENGTISTPDIIYNASGGQVNTLLGLEQIENRPPNYYGMGVFFDPPETPDTRAPHRPQLSRAVRVFASHRETDPIYCGIELFDDEYENVERRRQIAEIVQRELGLGEIRHLFPVPVELDQLKTAAISTPPIEGSLIPQMVLSGGDALVKPHFLTASGANIGLLGLLHLDHFLGNLIEKGQGDFDTVVTKYNRVASLLQKESRQAIVDLFARPLR